MSHLDPQTITALELAQARRDAAFLAGNTSALVHAQEDLDAAWAVLGDGEHVLVVEERDGEIEMDVEHFGCPMIEESSLNGYHGHAVHLCRAERLIAQWGLSEFFVTSEREREESGGDPHLLTPGRYPVEVAEEGDVEHQTVWLRIKESS